MSFFLLEVLIEGTVGDDFTGDIAIDDLSFLNCEPYDGESEISTLFRRSDLVFLSRLFKVNNLVWPLQESFPNKTPQPPPSPPKPRLSSRTLAQPGCLPASHTGSVLLLRRCVTSDWTVLTAWMSSTVVSRSSSSPLSSLKPSTCLQLLHSFSLSPLCS